ncbi:MAG: serine/threonine protein kinase [Deltaproteobacteria bacterium]|nr:serine/threonine protein kinase [Deltaproteobacteria bacterium]
MAQVFRARRIGPSGFRKEVAIKRLRPGTVGRDERMREALINEARNGGLLRHPGIVEIHEFDEVDDEWYLAMEFVDGWTLEEVLWRAASEELPPQLRSDTGAAGLAQAVVLDIARQMAHALVHAHEARDEQGHPLGLVHRDLKPANVFLTRAGAAKLGDFGLAKSRANLRQTTDADRTKGSPLYMSPEQVSGEPVDGRSDLFAVGTIIVELCVGSTPFEGSTVANTLVRVMEAKWDEIEDVMRQRAPALLPLCQRLLQQDPSDRYPSARALAAELDKFAGMQPLGSASSILAQAMQMDEPTRAVPAADTRGRTTAGMSIIEAAPGGGWGLLAALVLVLGLLMTAFLWVLRMPETSSGDFAGIRAPVAEDLAPLEAPPPRLKAPGTDASVAVAVGDSFLHEPPQTARLWDDLHLRVTQAAAGEWELRVAYRVPGSSWRLLPLGCEAATCAAALPVTSSDGMEYYLEADGPDGQTWSYGAETRPVRVAVR